MLRAVGTLVAVFVLCSAQAARAGDPVVIGLLADSAQRIGLTMRIAQALDHEEGLRILPMAGRGPVQSLSDLVLLRGVDAAILPSDTLAFAEHSGIMETLPKKLDYLVKLATLDVHVLAARSITDLQGLAGKRVAAGTPASSAYAAAQLLLARLNPPAKLLPLDGDLAIQALEAGEADAAFLVGDSPLPALRKVDGREVHLLEVPLPEEFAETYAPSLITDADYPQLIRKGGTVQTVAASLVIATIRWPKGSPQEAKMRTFSAALFAALQPGSEAAAEINLAASVPGWRRAPAAEAALKRIAKATDTVPE